MARKTTIEAFNRWIEDEANVEALLDAVAGGKTLRNAAMEMKQPYTCAHAYFHSTEELRARYDAARKSFADEKMDEALEIADEPVEDVVDVQRNKLRIETRQAQAKAFNRGLWGDKVNIEKTVTVGVDQAFLASVDDLLRLAQEKVVSEVPAALPAPASDE